MRTYRNIGRIVKISIASLVLAVLCMSGLVVSADAQQFTSVRPGGRAGTWDIILPLNYAESATINGQNGSSVNVDGGWGLGIGFGYNFTDNFELGGSFNWNERTYSANVTGTGFMGSRYTNWMDTSTVLVNGTFYILNGNFSPFVTGGMGFTYVDTNIPSGYSGPSSCWWDPWYGYVCNNYYQPTVTRNEWTYNAGVGVRFDLNRQMALRAGYYRSWVEFRNTSGGTPYFDNWAFDLVFRTW